MCGVDPTIESLGSGIGVPSPNIGGAGKVSSNTNGACITSPGGILADMFSCDVWGNFVEVIGDDFSVVLPVSKDLHSNSSEIEAGVL